MVDNVELMDKFEDNLNELIIKSHRSGLDYWSMLRLCLLRCIGLMLQSQAEYYLKGGR